MKLLAWLCVHGVNNNPVTREQAIYAQKLSDYPTKANRALDKQTVEPSVLLLHMVSRR